ncbi:MAG: DUF4402 domain-containing protein [Clostridia bacterium]|nr:DUF4402 domain-containing protein [Clostridia bacterium]
MKVKERKYIALVTLISMLIASFIPAQSFASEDFKPEVSIVVEEMDEEDLESVAEEEKNEKEEEQETVVIKAENTEDDSQHSAEAEAKEEEKTVFDKSSETENTDEKEDIDLSKLMPLKSLPEMVLTADTEVLGEATEPDKWYFGNELTIDEHFIFGEDRMYTEGKANRGFDYLLDNNTSMPFYVSTNDSNVNYQDLTGKEISVTFHTASPVVIDHFKIIAGGDTFKANYAHRNPTAWNLKAGNSLDSCDTVLVENQPVNATVAFEENIYAFENTTPYKYYKFTITALAGAGRSGHDSPFSNPTATCILADILIGGPEEEAHTHEDITFESWSSTDSLPTSAGNYYLENDVTISTRWDAPQGTTNLCLNGHAIIRINASETTGSVIQVGSGAKLNLYDCGTETRYYTVENPSANGAGLGKIVDESTYNSADENARGTFTGGYITGGNITGATDANHLIGGGVNVHYGAFTMNGGTIIGNMVCINAGGVKVKGAGASFTMNGGAIIANYNGCYGGAISVGDNGSNRLCTVTVNGGTIARNWSGRNGGAFHTDGYGHTFLINGGSIVNNYTNGYYDNGSNGRSGGGFLKDGATLKVSGSAVVKDNYNGGNFQNNIHFRTNNTDLLDLSGHLDSDADVGVYCKGLTSSADIKVATGAEKEDIAHLHFDIPEEGSLVFCDGEKDWIYLNGEVTEFTGAHHTHTAGTVWATAYVAPTHSHDDIDFYDWTATNSLPTAEGNYRLKGDVTLSSTWVVPSGTTNLCLDGHGIRLSGGITVINIPGGSTLNLYDCGETVHYFTAPEAGYGLATNIGDTDLGNQASFKGGYITGGTAMSQNQGGGVKVAGGTFNMHGGNITGNGYYANSDYGMRGSGVFVGGGMFRMYGGKITYNYAWNEGGGVDLLGSSSQMEMYGGEISHNHAQYESGGIHTWDSPTLKIYGGEICYNYSGDNGGAITIKLGTAYLSGGAIHDNSAKNSGGGIYYHNGSGILNVSGQASVTDNTAGGKSNNVYVAAGTIKVNDALSENAKIGVTLNNVTGIFTSGLSGKGTAENFKSDNKDYKVVKNNNGEAELVEKGLFDGNGTEEAPYLIQSADDWNALSDHINSGGTQYSGCYFKLTNDISVSTVLGNRPNTSTDSEDNVFSGTFDGDGHTLNVNISESGFAAPFAVAHNATIKNLHITGTITSTSNHAAGVVAASKDKTGYASSSLVIQNVTVSADISCNSHVAGIVGHAHKANITMENVVFDGSISASSVQGGFIGWGGIKNDEQYSSAFKDCVFAGTYRAGAAFYPVAFASGQGTATLINDFYTSSFGSGGSPIQTGGDGQVKLFAATVEKDGTVKYFGDFTTAVSSANWTDGSTLKLWRDVSYGSKILLSGGMRTLDLNGKTFTRTVTSDDGTNFDVSGGASITLTDTSTEKNGVITRQSGNYGGAVFFVHDSGSVFNMNAGKLTGFTSRVIIVWQGATVNMSGGEISGNSLNNGDPTDGIVRTYSSDSSAGGTFNMSGGKIINNTIASGKTGGAVYIGNNGTFNLSGDAQVTGNTQNESSKNVYLPSDTTINIVGPLVGDSSVGITLQSDTGIFTGGLSDNGTENYFISDNSNYAVALNDGEACLINMTLDVTASGYEGDYDGEAHSITVSVPDGATVKYGIEEGSYTLDTCPSYTNAGTYTVLFMVSKDGYNPYEGSATVTINKVDASLTNAPHAKDKLTYNEEEQELCVAGTATGGTILYALSSSDLETPGDEAYQTAVPKAAEVGNYYVWYKLEADANHNDLSPECIKITLAEPEWVTVSGVIYDSGKNPLKNATVSLMKGNKLIDEIRSYSNGGYFFTVYAGVYNIVVKTSSTTVTNIIDIYADTVRDIDLPGSGTDSYLDISESDQSVVVGGLDNEANSVRENDNVPQEKNVTVKMTVKSVSKNTSDAAKAIDAYAKDKNLDFFDLKVEKTVDSEVSTVSETQNVIEFVVPCSYLNKSGLSVYKTNGTAVQTLTESNSGEAGTYRVDKENGLIYIYLKTFSTVAMGYKPYYRVRTEISLGSFSGSVSVSLKKEDSDEKYELNNVSLDNISFTGIPKGSYIMTISWEDGAQNSISLPFTIN